ncbi:MAG: transcriptional regulator [Candidatus Aramenus sulfurataquae]|jgi:DNA-binding MarR family transcriptional regulator|nr:MAG: transcriptional regulator [Candidatus Aramenus sulfurataquae]MCL7344730.1 MarR family transcriptional regulator [Candidatus Aramenus sulfurataquae]
MQKNEDIQIFSSIAKIYRAMQRELNRRFQKLNISYLDFLILKATSEGPTTMVGLSRRFYVTQPAITSAIDRLEKYHLVERKRSAEDRRVIVITITEEGKRTFEEAVKIYTELASEILKDLGEMDDVLMKLNKILEKINEIENK